MFKLACYHGAVLLIFTMFASCRRDSTDVSKPKFNASDAAAQAIEMFDKNSDGSLDDQELKRSPGLAEGKKRADTNGDARLSEDEIEQRVQHWNDSRKQFYTPTIEVSVNRRLISGIELTLEPEPFLKEWISTARGTTDTSGQVPLSNTDFPGGLFMGYYKVTASLKEGTTERLPARYNTETELGIEITDDRPEVDLTIRFPLKSR